MEGRVWHTPGANVSANQRRAMLCAYYSSDFIRQQVNWDVCLSAETKTSLDADARAMLGLGARQCPHRGGLIRIDDTAERPDVAVSWIAGSNG